MKVENVLTLFLMGNCTEAPVSEFTFVAQACAEIITIDSNSVVFTLLCNCYFA